jgi:pimeloyl-ACP methyl ester carboxylesterase
MKNKFYFLYTKIVGFFLNVISLIFPRVAIKIAFDLFSQPRKGRISIDSLPEFAKKAKIDSFSFKGQRFKAYIWKGNETTVLLAHGWESNSLRWQKLLPYLQEKGFTIVAVDGPAHGISTGNTFDIPKYAAFINIVAQEYKPQYLIGHSMGGITCLFYQYFYKNSTVKKIVSVGSPCDFKIILQNYYSLLSINTTIVNGLDLQYRKILRSSISFFSASYFASKIDCKGLIYHDINDATVSIEEAKKIASSWGDSEFIETEGLDHSMQDETLYKKITSFLSESD